MGRLAADVLTIPEKWYTIRYMFGTILRRVAMIFLCAVFALSYALAYAGD